MKYTYLVLLCLLFFSAVIEAQIITIKDAHSGEPIAYVLGKCEGQNLVVESNTKGQLDIQPLVSCRQLILTHLGYDDKLINLSEGSPSPTVIEMLPTGFSIDHVVISATRWMQRTRETPFKVNTITKDRISLLNPQTAADLLGASGEVYIQKSQQGGGSPMIRGFSTNRLLYAVDGVRMNTAIFRAGNLQNVISLDPFATERTEVLFGPGSVIYGSDAIGGVMSFTTLTPELSTTDKVKLKGNAAVRYSSANNEKTGHIDFGMGWKKFAFVTSISANDYGDLKMGSKGPDEYLRKVYSEYINGKDSIFTNSDPLVQVTSRYMQYNLIQKIRFTPSVNWDVQYGFHHSRTSENSRYDRLIRYRNGLPRYGEWNYGPQIWTMHNFSVAHKTEGSIYDEIVARVAYQYFEESRLSRDINKKDRLVQTEKVDAYSFNLDLTKKISDKNVLSYGLEWVRNEVTSLGHIENVSTSNITPTSTRYPLSDWSSYALYLTNSYKVSESFSTYAGLRYNQFGINAQFDTTYFPFPYQTAKVSKGALTGNLGLNWRANEATQLTFNLSTGFRSPNIDDLGKVFDSTPGSVTVPNPDLAAETAYNAEVALTRVWGYVLKLDVAAYYTYLKNAMVRRPFTFNGQDSIVYAGELSRVEAIQNAAKATVYGFQAAVEARLIPHLFVMVRYNYQIGEEELDDGSTFPSRHAAPSFGQTYLSWRASRLTLQAGIEFMGQKDFDELPPEEQAKDYLYAIDAEGKPYSPSWTIFNVKSMYKISKNLVASLGVENFTDVRYRPYSSGICAAGRNFVLSLRAGF
ncbi:MAG: TonB-dependent receptor [Saprospiraceae bacterium]|nr:TonB-dependent receptor [Saprospiraceae bacterium]